MNNKKIVGIVGGVGPYAGIDLTRKIFEQTEAKRDQEHLPIALLSIPQEIEDRTLFLLGQTSINPAYAILKIIEKLEEMGASVVGIPCNTAHTPQIFDVIVENLKKADSSIKLVHMINEVARFIQENHPQIRNVGVLSTTGTYKTKVYPIILGQKGMNVILPNDVLQDIIHTAIYDPIYGIKAQSNPVTQIAKRKLIEGINYLQKEGAEAIVLGCTEITIAITDNKIGKTIIIDPTLILARALIREVNLNKLKPYDK
ncbi:MAG: aspartate/glutamate racemase family protein [Candidatus Cloacimonetes bacterium]|nr:aspartate/glutamate racemase family protein [Candidatus Cloacimonadota bacterium]